MPRILVDSDVLLDVALSRQPHFEASSAVLRWALSYPEQAAVAWHTLSNIAYLMRKQDARAFLQLLVDSLQVPTVNTGDARRALALPMSDIEDALQASTAVAFHAEFIVTRNLSDYRDSPVLPISPEEFLLQVALP